MTYIYVLVFLILDPYMSVYDNDFCRVLLCCLKAWRRECGVMEWIISVLALRSIVLVFRIQTKSSMVSFHDLR